MSERTEKTKIQWTDFTFNPWIGCTKVSPGCAHCYAESEDKRRGWTEGGWGKGKPRKRTSVENWKKPLRWNREGILECNLCGWRGTVQPPQNSIGHAYTHPDPTVEFRNVRPRVFCASLADWLDEEVPVDWLGDLLELIRQTPNLDWQLLTKRPENWRKRLSKTNAQLRKESPFNGALHSWTFDWLQAKAPTNVWIGTSVEDQGRADERIPELLEIPAVCRFLSVEPMLGPVDLSRWFDDPMQQEGVISPVYGGGLHWVICGGESGPGARPFNMEWARSLRDQCVGAAVPFFLKQLGRKAFDVDRSGHAIKGVYPALKDRKGGDPSEWPADLRVREFPLVNS